MWQRASDTVNLEIRMKIHMFEILSDFFYSFIAKKYININYNHAQVDLDFGQVYIVWWLSYTHGGEKTRGLSAYIARGLLELWQIL